MTRKKQLIASAVLALMVSAPAFSQATSPSMGHGSHNQASVDHSSMGHGSGNHGSMAQGSMAQSGANKMFLEKREIDGYTVSFHVMQASDGGGHGGSHNLMIKVEQGNAVVSELQANSKVIYPGGTDESKPLMKMGDWYMTGYDLQPSGKHQLMVLFKTGDGQKHFGGVYYGE